MSRKTALLYRTAVSVAVALLIAQSPPASAADPPAGLAVAVIDVGRLLQDSTAGQREVAGLRVLKQKSDGEQAARSAAILELRERIEAGALSLAPEALDDLRRQLEDATIEFQRLRTDSEREFNEAEREAFNRIQSEVMPIIEAFGGEKGYSLIFNKFDSGLVFAAHEVDITDLILERYDAMQEAQAEAGADG